MMYDELIRRAHLYRSIAEDDSVRCWWAAYIRGLHRARDGENFGTPEEHAHWLGRKDALGDAYRAGMAGQWAEPPMTEDA